ncbi:hypothetical protein PACTADRAFT_36038 [Pachysolen tannophilus NRRL Y-2460]|uniref:Transcriptional repressor OPI1 n=1 Tax=Pachysolen tannophilus NRRL Y-2460 TaxID=669874 RepID=A0A1E4TNX3_PACTA|nr:hypothetical protein PACTADRAFT_36038 [Pachysolen tannophilus NRRL Y-2460]
MADKTLSFSVAAEEDEVKRKLSINSLLAEEAEQDNKKLNNDQVYLKNSRNVSYNKDEEEEEEEEKEAKKDEDEDEDVFMAVEALEALKNGNNNGRHINGTNNSGNSNGETFLNKVASYPLILNSIKILEKNLNNLPLPANRKRWFNNVDGNNNNSDSRNIEDSYDNNKRLKLSSSRSFTSAFGSSINNNANTTTINENDNDPSMKKNFQDIKDLSFVNLNIESRRKLQMLINFLKIGNAQLNQRIENLMKNCELERLKKLEKQKNYKLVMEGKQEIQHTENTAKDLKQEDEEEEDEEEEEEEEEEYHDANDSLLTPTNSNNKYDLSNSSSNDPINQIKHDIVGTVKKIVKVVSKFTGNSLPEPARSNVRELLLRLPNNWAISLKEKNEQILFSTNHQLFKNKELITDPNGKVLILAQESLDMIKKIITFCNDSLEKAEVWNLEKTNEQESLREKLLMNNHINRHQQKTNDKKNGDNISIRKRSKIDINDLVHEENENENNNSNNNKNDCGPIGDDPTKDIQTNYTRISDNTDIRN